jgi:hypothetical protein
VKISRCFSELLLSLYKEGLELSSYTEGVVLVVVIP